MGVQRSDQREDRSTGRCIMTTLTLLTNAKLTGKFAAIWRDKRGQDLIEYALLAGFVAVAAGAIFPTTLTPNISQIFSKIGSILNQA